MASDDGTDSRGNGAIEVRPDTDQLFLDVMLGKLAVYLRMCGYDAAYAGDKDIEADDRLLELAADEARLLLTRDVQLANRARDAILLTERDIEAQLEELRDSGVELEVTDCPQYCGRCNGSLEPIAENETTPEYAPDLAATDCWRCQECGQLFWNGSHHERMKETLQSEEVE